MKLNKLKSIVLINLFLITLLSLALWPNVAMAQEPFSEVILSPPLSGAAIGSVDWGDYDNDGDLDIFLTGCVDAYPYDCTQMLALIYRNDGLNTFTSITIDASLDGVSDSSATWGDYDNDGDLDILLTGSSGTNSFSRVYRNDGANLFTLSVNEATLPAIYQGEAIWGDYDNDNDLDILLTGYDDQYNEPITRLYRNDGADVFIEVMAEPLLQDEYGSNVAWGDYDNDGDLDMLLIGYGGLFGDTSIIRLYRNDGNNLFTEIPSVSNLLDHDPFWVESGVTWGDYDNDGDLDILFSSQMSELETNIYRNEGNDQFTDLSYDLGLEVAHYGDLAWGDYDNDGDLDILLTGSKGGLNIARVYRNDVEYGNIIFTLAVTESTLTGVLDSSVAWGDYDNDGDLDILLAGCTIYNIVCENTITKLYQNNLTQNIPFAPNTPPTTPTGLNATVQADTVTLSWQAATDTQTITNTGLTYNVRIGTAPGLSDVAGPMAFTDGLRLLPEMGNAQHGLTATYRLPAGTYYWSVQAIDTAFAGSPFATEGSFIIDTPFSQIDTALPGVTQGSGEWGDYDNDGDLDILLTGCEILQDYYNCTNKVAQVYRNNGSNSFTPITIDATLAGIHRSSAVWGDYDNDGDLDILLTGFDGSNDLARIYRNDGNDLFTLTVNETTLSGVEWGNSLWGDYDNDGDLDVLLTGYNQYDVIINIYRNDGANNFTQIMTELPLEGVYDESTEWGDYDNDGDLDILLTGQDAYLSPAPYIYRNNGNNTFTKVIVLDVLLDVELSKATWGDYDNDGDLDILLANNNEIEIHRNDGVGFTPITITPSPPPGFLYGDMAWGDYDNDGDLDILFTGLNNNLGYNLAQVYRNDENDTFIALATETILTGVENGSVDWGDYDNDGDLDILLTGCTYYYNNYDSCLNTITHLYQNNLYLNIPFAPNTPPTAPTGLNSTVQTDTVILSWQAATDTQTISDAGLTYNVRIGTAPNLDDVVGSMAFTDGLRLLPQMGNAQHGLTATYRLPAGTYYWSVQAVDTAFAGSPFATEGSFTIDTPFSRIDINLPGVATGSVDWGDYDNDGDLDLLLTGCTLLYDYYWFDCDSSLAQIYRNDAGNVFTPIAIDPFIEGIYLSNAVWGDYDNDGDLDILLTGVESYNSIIGIYRNDGNNLFTLSVSNMTLTSVAPGDIIWGDYDNDGDLDILLTGKNAELGSNLARLYRNDGNDTFIEVIAEPLLKGVSDSKIFWGDYDNDGDLDILLSGYVEYENMIARLYRNDGENIFTQVISEIDLEIYVSHGIAIWGDYDNDGDLDILVTAWGDYYTTIYRNDGTDVFFPINIQIQPAPLPNFSYGDIAWEDYDNDGDLDIIFTGSNDYDNSPIHNKPVTIYRNDGNNILIPTYTDPLLIGLEYSSVDWGDYDNDGDLDIVFTGCPYYEYYYDSCPNPITQLYQNNLYQNIPFAPNTPPTTPTGLNATVQADTVTLSWQAATDNQTIPDAGLTYNVRIGTAPGLSDVASPMAFNDGLRLLPQMGNVEHGLTATYRLPAGTYYWSVQAVDTAFAGSPFATEGSFIIDTLFNQVDTTLLGVTRGNANWGDYDNDGDLDIILTGCLDEYNTNCTNSLAKIYRNDGSSIFTPITLDATLDRLYDSNAVWGDYDNDGDLDILLTGSNNANSLTRIYRNDGSDSFSLIINESTLTGIYNSESTWADYDNDGDLDILLSGKDQSNTPTTRLYRNDGGNTFTNITTYPFDNPDYAFQYDSLAWGDYDNDGDLDLLLNEVTNHYYPPTRLYRNDPGDAFTEIILEDNPSTPNLHNNNLAWGDYDNDGDLDILLAGEDTNGQPVANIYRNDGANLFTLIAITPTPLLGFSNGDMAWADYDNDGDLDILFTGLNTDLGQNIARVYRNDANDTFTAAVTETLLTGVENSSVAWGDYDNDGDWDILLTGCPVYIDGRCPNRVTELYSNNLYQDIPFAPNTPPNTPTNLNATVEMDRVTLSWQAVTDTQTISNAGLNYNVRIGTAPGLNDVVGSMALPNGLRLLPEMGNAQHGLTATYQLPAGTYYWSVQAIDTTLAGSPFATEGTFTIDTPFSKIDIAVFDEFVGYKTDWGDYDNDGDLDIIVIGCDVSYMGWGCPYTDIYRNDGYNQFTWVTYIYDYAARNVMWGDYDNDGDLDILLASADPYESTPLVYRNDGADVFTPVFNKPTDTEIENAMWGDYDNDNDLDILLIGVDQDYNPLTRLYRNDGADTFTQVTIQPALEGIYYGSLDWGDYDNDGDLDILLAGEDQNNSSITKLYRNDSNDIFTEVNTGMPEYEFYTEIAIAIWGDYDNDGDLDILSNQPDDYYQNIYRNDGNDLFTPVNIQPWPLQDFYSGDLAWADYDNDGDLDILLTGKGGSSDNITKLYRNDGNNTFIEVVSEPFLTGVEDSNVEWGDYDNDGDLDILLTGCAQYTEYYEACLQSITKIYQNNLYLNPPYMPHIPNTPPTTPTGLNATVQADTVTLSWQAATDTQTITNTGLTYNVRIGSESGLSDVVGPMALANGLRLVPDFGNAEHGISASYVLSCGTYSWSVQAIDTAFAGSPFATEGSFDITELTAQKSVSPSINAPYHGPLTYTLSIINNANCVPTDVSLNDTLPPQVTFSHWLSAPSNVNINNNIITWNGNISNNQSITFSFVVTHTGDYNDEIINSAVISYNQNSQYLTAVATSTIEGNLPPIAYNSTHSTLEDTPLNSTLSAFDPNGDTLTYTLSTAPLSGTLNLNALTGGFIYTPAQHLNGQDHFTFYVNDGLLNSSLATATLIITPVNDAPLAIDDSYSILEDSPTVTLSVLNNDLDIDNDELWIVALGIPNQGGLAVLDSYSGTTILPGKTISYTPAANYYGTETFTYTIADGSGLTDTATITITLNNTNDAPLAIDDISTVFEDSNASTIDVLANDTYLPDPAEVLSITTVSQGSNGSVIITNNGADLSYTPVLNFNGTDSFSYTITDEDGLSDTASVTVTVTPINDAPLAIADQYTLLEDSPPITLSVLNNDLDIDGDSLWITAVGIPSQGGTAIIIPQGGSGTLSGTLISYAPATDFYGVETFTYTISDGFLSDTTTVTLTINNLADAPLALDDTATIAEDSVATPINVLANDTYLPDPAEVLSISTVSQGSNGSVIITNNGADLSYTPALNFNGTDSFTYSITDEDGLSDSATVTVIVTPVNDAPLAVADVATTTQNNGLTISVLNNDSDPDGDTLTVSAVTTPTNGIATTDGNFVSYSPNPTFVGTDTFTYTLWDGLATDTATVTITVTEIITSGTPELNIIKTVSGLGGGTSNLPLGSVVTYTITLSNSGNAQATNITLTDALPTQLSFNSWLKQDTATLNGNTITWSGFLTAQHSLLLQFTANIVSGSSAISQTITNTVTYSSSNAGQGSSEATITILSFLQEESKVYLPFVVK